MHNVFVNQARRRRYEIEQAMEEVPAVSIRATQSEQLELQDVDRVLRSLSPEQREVVLLVAVEQLTYEEVSGALDIPIGTVMSRLSRARERMRQLLAGLRYAAAAAIFALGIGLGWIVRGMFIAPQLLPTSFARLAATAHVVYAPEVRHPVEVTADDEQHLVNWLSKRLGTTLKAPKLGPLGYELVGGRLLSGPQGPVAHFMYQDARGQRLTLYVSKQRG